MKDKKVIKRGNGSALILAVVLVSLLAVVGVMFAMVARIDKMSTSAIAENKTLNLAIDTVIAKISQELALDVPGMPFQEYYDYPDVNNAWLASLEPYEYAAGDYRWWHISDIYNKFGPQDACSLPAEIIPDYQSDVNDYYFADADGDGVSDSMWVKLENITSSKGRPIYAAVRIIDNGGMLNVNTGYKFDPCDPEIVHIDGSSQMQINLLALSQRGVNPNAEADLQACRCGTEPNDRSLYEQNVVWRYDRPNGAYTPFDISDELELKNRFLLNQRDTDVRTERSLRWAGSFLTSFSLDVPRNKSDHSINNPNHWFYYANYGSTDPNNYERYDYRHIATTYNMDRIINPVGPTLNSGRMVNINNPADANELYYTLLASIDPNITGGVLTQIKEQFAQLAVNMVDFIDGDIAVTVLEPNDPDIRPAYYGFDAQPFITEIGFIIDVDPQAGRNYYAVELYNPFSQDISLADFKLVLIDSNDPLSPFSVDFDSNDIIPADGHFVIANDLSRFNIDPNNTNTKEGPILVFFGGWQPPLSVAPPPPPGPPVGIKPPSAPASSGWKYNYILYLKRKVGDPNNPDEIYVDRQWIDPDPVGPNEEKYLGRDVRDWRIVYQNLIKDTVNLGSVNTIESTGFPFSFFLPNPLVNPQKFVTVGDIPRILTIGHSDGLNSTIGEQLMFAVNEDEIRLDLQNPNYSNIFQYLTVFDPSTDGIDNDGDNDTDEDANDRSEWKIPGRVNVNTAPWYVIAQLPWVSYELAKAIADYRDYSIGSFGSIGQLNYVNQWVEPNSLRCIDYYAQDADNLLGFPDLTPTDGIIDDFEERDVIFSRISNLVTVRSDVFTAYILVRIGSDGPQKRAIAILDRSDVYPNPLGGYIGRVKARALHPVPDPR